MKFAHCLQRVFVIGEYTDIFFGEEEEDFVLRVVFDTENFPWARRIFLRLTSQGKFYSREFDRITIRNFSSPTQISTWRSAGGIRKLFSACLDFWGKISMEGGISGMKGKMIRN